MTFSFPSFFLFSSLMVLFFLLGGLTLSQMLLTPWRASHATPPKVNFPFYSPFYSSALYHFHFFQKLNLLLLLPSLLPLPPSLLLGAMYAFPCISLPEKACAIAKEKGVAPDLYYSMDLLENTGEKGREEKRGREKERRGFCFVLFCF